MTWICTDPSAVRLELPVTVRLWPWRAGQWQPTAPARRRPDPPVCDSLTFVRPRAVVCVGAGLTAPLASGTIASGIRYDERAALLQREPDVERPNAPFARVAARLGLAGDYARVEW
jgi:hypothetical protein